MKENDISSKLHTDAVLAYQIPVQKTRNSTETSCQEKGKEKSNQLVKRHLLVFNSIKGASKKSSSTGSQPTTIHHMLLTLANITTKR